MRKFLTIVFLLITVPSLSFADSVILMIGDGMGFNHIKCVGRDNSLFLNSILLSGRIHTASADSLVTDSAASATAYSCGIKTNNYFIAMTPDKASCTTLAEAVKADGKNVYLISSDGLQGATPAAFYAHATNRYQKDKIMEDYKKAAEVFDMDMDVASVKEAVDKLLPKLAAETGDYFVMIEGAKIDKASHEKDYQWMEKELIDFDQAVQAVFEFAKENDKVHVFVTADHETGGLTDKCKYTIGNHTGVDVPLFAQSSETLPESMENIELNHLMHRLLLGD